MFRILLVKHAIFIFGKQYGNYDFGWNSGAANSVAAHSSRVPGSVLSSGYCLYGVPVHALQVGFLSVHQFPPTSQKLVGDGNGKLPQVVHECMVVPHTWCMPALHPVFQGYTLERPV